MKYTLKQFQAEYPNDDACLRRVLDMKYGGTEFSCPSCGADSKFHRIAKRRAFACQHCGHHIYPCVGTPFEKSRTPLTDWFLAMYLMTSTRHGVAAKELERQIGCTYKTAWRMAHELRKLMAQADTHEPLTGEIEVDETYVGGKPRSGNRNISGRGAANKTVVFGMLERGGSVRAGPVPNVRGATLQTAIAQNVQRGSMIYSDEFSSYRSLRMWGFRHRTVRHSIKQYVKGPVHVNSLEGYWSRLKVSIRGTHVHVSPQHLWKYVSEFSFRYNQRRTPGAMFDLLIQALSQPHLAEN